MVAILHCVPTRRDGYRLSEIEGETLLYNDEKMTMIYLNESGAAIWRLCDGKRSVATIIELLRAAYPDLADQLETDVCNAIQQFADCELLTLV